MTMYDNYKLSILLFDLDKDFDNIDIWIMVIDDQGKRLIGLWYTGVFARPLD